MRREAKALEKMWNRASAELPILASEWYLQGCEGPQWMPAFLVQELKPIGPLLPLIHEARQTMPGAEQVLKE